MSAVPVSAMGRSAERPPRRLLRPPSSRSRRYAGLPVSACGLRLGHAPPVTLLRPLARPARTALRASSWQPVVVPAGELDEGLPGRSEPSFLSGRGPPSPGASISGGRVAGAAPRSAMVATGWRPLVSEDGFNMRVPDRTGISIFLRHKPMRLVRPTSPSRGGRNCWSETEAVSGGGLLAVRSSPLPENAVAFSTLPRGEGWARCPLRRPAATALPVPAVARGWMGRASACLFRRGGRVRRWPR